MVQHFKANDKLITDMTFQHWNFNIIILMKCSSRAALEVVILTTSSAASDVDFVKMMEFMFHWMPSSV